MRGHRRGERQKDTNGGANRDAAMENRAGGPDVDDGPAARVRRAAGPQVYARVAGLAARRLVHLRGTVLGPLSNRLSGPRNAAPPAILLPATVHAALPRSEPDFLAPVLPTLLPALLPRLLQTLLPCACVLCRGVQASVVCAGCAADLLVAEPRCGRCALPGRFRAAVCLACQAHAPPFDAAVTLGDYDAERAGLVLALKFGGKLPLAGWLAAALARRWRDGPATGMAGNPACRPALPDLVIPVPLAPARLSVRGFNQSWEIARRLAGHLGVRADATCLARPRDTSAQSTLDLTARQANMAGAFCLSAARGGRAIAGLHIAVVDDVMTTGATLAEAATVLKRHGAGRVTVVTALRTP
jgi:ComF family protein